jgi:hypothetical protein
MHWSSRSAPYTNAGDARPHTWIDLVERKTWAGLHTDGELALDRAHASTAGDSGLPPGFVTVAAVRLPSPGESPEGRGADADWDVWGSNIGFGR